MLESKRKSAAMHASAEVLLKSALTLFLENLDALDFIIDVLHVVLVVGLQVLDAVVDVWVATVRVLQLL